MISSLQRFLNRLQCLRWAKRDPGGYAQARARIGLRRRVLRFLRL